MKHLVALICMGTLIACAPPQTPPDPGAMKQEVMTAEKAFSEMAARDGVPAAFAHFAADDVVMHRGSRLVKGKVEMKEYYAKQTLKDVKLSWEPTFVDVAASGDLAYTYGPYTFSAKDTSGTEITDTGFFHTVWKRQADGEWKFVWD
jgi:ketosteroid isomerase-like protein